MRPQLNPLILGPGAPWSLPGSSLDIQFTTGRAAVNRQKASISSLLNTTRASTGYASTSTGSLTLFPTNTPRITDLGLLVEQAATNLLLQSQTLATSPWGESHAGTATAPTVTNAFGTAPDGTTTACRVQMALNGGTTSSDRSDWAQTVTVSNATTYTLSFYVQSNTVSTYVMQIGDNTTGTVSSISVTPTKARVSMQFLTASTTATPRLRLRGGQTPTNSDSVDILVWGAQLEASSFATSYIPTTTVAVTRAADSILLAGSALTAALASKAAYTQTKAVNANAINSNDDIVYWSGAGQALRFGGNTVVISDNAVNAAAQTTIGGAGTWTGRVKSAYGYDTSSYTAIANGGTQATSAFAWGSLTGNVSLGNRSSDLGRSINGYLERVAFGSTKGMFDGLTT